VSNVLTKQLVALAA